MSVAVVTDSTSYLPPNASAAMSVVPLTVVINGVEGSEGVDVTPAEVARALGGRRVSVTTSRPSPAAFADLYRRLLDGGASSVVSVHLSAQLSGTVESARLAAAEIGPRVSVVDAKSTGMGLGFAALAASAAATRGASASDVTAAAVEAASRTSTLFYVDTLEFLRRGGRISAASALLGTALSVKPILHMVDGDVAVHHLDGAARAAQLSDTLASRLGDRLRDLYVTEIGAAVAAHVGPGLASVVVHRRS
jgi:DegV family protein with EDD domain